MILSCPWCTFWSVHSLLSSVFLLLQYFPFFNKPSYLHIFTCNLIIFFKYLSAGAILSSSFFSFFPAASSSPAAASSSPAAASSSPAADGLLEEHVGEGGSRSSWPRDLRDGKQRVSPFNHAQFYLQRWSSYCHQMNVFVFTGRGAEVTAHNGCPVLSSSGFGFGWFDWELLNCWTTCPACGRWATSEPNSFIQWSLKETFGGGRGHIKTFSYIISRIHHMNFRDTISWECFVKNDSVRSCLIELQSFLQSKVDVDPIHRILMFLPCFVHVSIVQDALLTSQSCQDPSGFCPWNPQAERILSVCFSNFDLQVSIPSWWWNVNWLHIRHEICPGRGRSE